jgi:predicted nucleotidyltransferase
MKTIESRTERRFLRRLLAGNGSESPAAVVLIGSFARGSSASQNSDVDLLVIGGERPTHIPARFQIMRLTPDELRDRVSAGDDLAQWALRFGAPISGRQAWSRLRDQLLPDAPWPDWRRKLDQARGRAHEATVLLDMGDLDAAQEQTLFALSHLARAELLRRHVFPLARPEIPAQLEAQGDASFAELMREVDGPPLSVERLRGLIELLRGRC